MWWASKHYEELGNPDYIGFCHYRRFFTSNNINSIPIVNINNASYNSSYALSPMQLLHIQTQTKFKIATMFPIKVAYGKNICEQIEYLDHAMTVYLNDQLFAYFKSYLPQKYYDVFEDACNQPSTHLCNIFVMCREKFLEYIDAAIKALIEFHNKFYANQFHSRYLGYYLERLTSTFIYCNKLLNETVISLPLMTIDGNVHVKP